MSSTRVVAIDGPSGSGKSTVARAVADALGLEVLDTGAMYRSVTLAALEAGVDPDDAGRLAELAHDVPLEVAERVLLGGRDVTTAIREPDVTRAVSAVSAHPAVRTELVARQRAWVEARSGGVVEGRDIGTVVFPHAPVKIYLTASDNERARRRQRDEESAARDIEVDDVRDDMARRDRLDSQRTTSPLRVADDAITIDTTGRTAGAVADEIVQQFREATGA